MKNALESRKRTDTVWEIRSFSGFFFFPPLNENPDFCVFKNVCCPRIPAKYKHHLIPTRFLKQEAPTYPQTQGRFFGNLYKAETTTKKEENNLEITFKGKKFQ